jgi:hypothetical protein
MLVVALDHLEQVVGRRLLVGEDERLVAAECVVRQ